MFSCVSRAKWVSPGKIISNSDCLGKENKMLRMMLWTSGIE